MKILNSALLVIAITVVDFIVGTLAAGLLVNEQSNPMGWLLVVVHLVLMVCLYFVNRNFTRVKANATRAMRIVYSATYLIALFVFVWFTFIIYSMIVSHT